MTSARSVILHVGMPKSGSSALQIAFVRNRAQLEQHGVSYPPSSSDARAQRGEIVSGNGAFLQPFLVGSELEMRDEVFSQVDRAVGDARAATTLYSSELLFFARPGPLSDLREHLEQAGVRLQAALFVRDVLPLALSTYTQHVKRSRFTGSFTDFLDAHQSRLIPMRERLETFIEALGVHNVRVLHYEANQDNLVDCFFSEVLRVPSLDVAVAPSGRVNRTLTAREVDYMRHLNTLLDDNMQARAFGDALTTLPLGSGDPVRASAQDIERLNGWCADQIEWVNDTFFDGRQTLKMPDTSDAADSSTRQATAPATLTDPEVQLLGAIARIIRQYDDRLVAERTERQRSAQVATQARAKVRQLKGELRLKRRETRRAYARIQRIKERTRAAEHELKTMQASASWRVTRPLRAVRRAFR